MRDISLTCGLHEYENVLLEKLSDSSHLVEVSGNMYLNSNFSQKLDCSINPQLSGTKQNLSYSYIYYSNLVPSGNSRTLNLFF